MLTASVLALTFLASASASSLYFYFSQGTGTQSAQAYGDISVDNPTSQGTANNIAAPAISLTMAFFNPWADLAIYQCTADTNVSAGTYLVGDFTSGADCYADIQ